MLERSGGGAVLDTRPLMRDERSIRTRTGMMSLAVHGCVLLALTGALHFGRKRALYRLPGTARGVRLLTYYAPGNARPATGDPARKEVASRKATPTRIVAMAAPKLKRAMETGAEHGIAGATVSGVGDGNISIALPKFFPHPLPDLSMLPHGTKGNIIFNAVIDEQGRITDLTLLHGLGRPVDDEVLMIVRNWTYTPAMKDGAPVSSEQELHFYYERG